MGMQISPERSAGFNHDILRSLFRVFGSSTVLGGILFLALIFFPVAAAIAVEPAGQSISLAWEASSGPDIAGYNIYYGGTSGSYTNMVNVGNVTNAAIYGLVAGATYFFAATTYDFFGNESDYSNETSYTVPTTTASVQIRGAADGQFILTVAGLAGHTYQILATQDFTAWTVIGTVVVETGGSLEFTDTNTASYSKRFYRTQESP